MIKRTVAEKHCDVYYEIEMILVHNSDMCLTKEEIYARLPKGEDDIPIPSFSSMTNALRALVRARAIDCFYHKGVLHYGYKDTKDRPRY